MINEIGIYNLIALNALNNLKSPYFTNERLKDGLLAKYAICLLISPAAHTQLIIKGY